MPAARGARRDYADRHPGPNDIALVVEVADDSLSRDRGVKRALYARAGIAVYWIVNLRTVEVFAGPSGDEYAQRADYLSGSAVPLVVAGQELTRIAVDSLLP